MKKQNAKNSLNYPLIAIVVFCFVAVIYIVVMFNGKQNISYPTPSYAPTQTTKERIYRSKTLKFSINTSADFKIEEKFFRVTLSSAKGKIYIERGGTNFDNIDDYLNDLDKRNNSVTQNKEKIYISNLSAIRGTVGNNKYYFIYADKWIVFTLFTDLDTLFSALDQIAQSFRYTP